MSGRGAGGHHRSGEHAGVHAHRRAAPESVPTAVLTVSDTRTPETDTGGNLVVELLEGGGQVETHDRRRVALRHFDPPRR